MNIIEIQGNIQVRFKIFVALLVPFILYWNDLALVANEALNSEISTHILMIPFLLTYILYRIRRILAATMSEQVNSSTSNTRFPFKDHIGALMCLIAYLIKWYGSYTFHPLEYHIASLPLFVAGIILIIFNTQTLRTLLFPLAFLAFLIPPPVELAQSAGSALAILSSQAAYNILKILRLPVNLIITYGSPLIFLKLSSGEEIPFTIDMACSGLYSLIGFAIFALFTTYIFRGPLKKKIAIFSMGLPIIYSLNVVRIILIVIIGFIIGPTFALEAFHLLGGWTLILIGTLLFLTLAEKTFNIQIFKVTPNKCLHFNSNNDNSICLDCGKLLKKTLYKSSKMDAIKTVLILLISISLLFIQVPVFAITEGFAEVFSENLAGEKTTAKILPKIEGYLLEFGYRDVEFEKISGQNASLFFRYIPLSNSKPIIWVGLEIGATRSCLHAWEVCLVSWPQTHGYESGVTQLDLRDIHLIDNPPLTARYFVFQKKVSNEIQVILYWYTRSVYITEEGHQLKWTKISVIEYADDPQEVETSEAELLPIAKAIVNYWQPITNWSSVSLTIAKNGTTLITISAALLTGVIIITLYLETKKKNKAKHTYSQISDSEDLNIINSIDALEKETVTETKIAIKYKEITGKDVDPERLHNKLMEAMEADIINRKIININDEPYMTWKLTFNNKINLNALAKIKYLYKKYR